jgi:hypothetical protein
MATTFDKLNLKDQTQILVLNSPASFEPELATLRGVKIVRDAKSVDAINFSLVFVTQQKEVDALAKAIAKKATGDAVVWFAYPKGTSKKYKSEINRDSGWGELGKAGFECVRLVAIDEDWTASRFRRVEFIKTMTRDKKWSISKQGKSKPRTTKKSASKRQRRK